MRDRKQKSFLLKSNTLLINTYLEVYLATDKNYFGDIGTYLLCYLENKFVELHFCETKWFEEV